MSLLAALTVKVSAILLLALVAALGLRTRSAAARHWVLAIGVMSACVAPALHVLPIPPVMQVAPVGALAWSAGPVFEALRLRPHVPSTAPADTGVVGPAVASDSAGRRPGRSRPEVVSTVFIDAIGRWAVAIWLVGAAASAGVRLVGLARLRWLRASSRRVTEGPWHRLCADLARSSGVSRRVDLLFGPRPALVATWGWRRPVVMLPPAASAWSAERMRIVFCCTSSRTCVAATGCCRRRPKRCAASGGSIRWRGSSVHGSVANANRRPTTWYWPPASRPRPVRRISSTWRERFGNTGGRGCRRRRWRVRHIWNGGCPPC